ncbi:Phosphoribosyl-ATP pyrophosphatase [Candidatus Hodgkinia cicadicola]|uniref:phosphoribosyl-ATP diphosphatase n=1 Tax=Candidatus Hodgkinia cicadicola TaxID=573658 RepID=A0ABX4MI30_9HYPH|nr:Phosphoribosyl-ATP pyrophosphatase [Candidatus Hodgkinia cicadicola]
MLNNVIGRWKRPWFVQDIYRLMSLINNKAQILSDPRSWTTRLLSSGTKFILKKIGEEQTELLLALRFESDHEVIMESIDLMYHIILLTKNIGLNLNQTLRMINIRPNWVRQQNLYNTTKPSGLAWNNYRTSYPSLIGNYLVNTTEDIILKRLNNTILNLILIVTKLGTKGFRCYTILNTLVINAIRDIVGLTSNRGIKHYDLTNEIMNRTGG